MPAVNFSLDVAKRIINATKTVERQNRAGTPQRDVIRDVEFWAYLAGPDVTGKLWSWVMVEPRLDTDPSDEQIFNDVPVFRLADPPVSGYQNAAEANHIRNVPVGAVVRLRLVGYTPDDEPRYVFHAPPRDNDELVPPHDHRSNNPADGGFAFAVYHPGTSLPQMAASHIHGADDATAGSKLMNAKTASENTKLATDMYNQMLAELGANDTTPTKGTRTMMEAAETLAPREDASLDPSLYNADLAPTLAAQRGVPFVELDREIEREAGTSMNEILLLHGQAGYRRYERRALFRIAEDHADGVVMTTGGSIVSERETFDLLQSRFYCVWLKASPEQHMSRVVAQGDMRPMAANPEAMEDLRRILDGRADFYSKADLTVDTSQQTPEQSLQRLVQGLRKLGPDAPH